MSAQKNNFWNTKNLPINKKNNFYQQVVAITRKTTPNILVFAQYCNYCQSVTCDFDVPPLSTIHNSWPK